MSTRNPFLRRALTPALLATALAVAAATLSACGSSSADEGAASGPTTITVGAHAKDAATATKLTVKPDAVAVKLLPADVKKSGTLKIGVGALPAGFPPLAFVGDDEKTLTGSEPDLGRLVAATLGLKADVQNSSWENLFVGIDSSKFDVGFSNITDTEERKEKYDFASYRKDELGFEVLADNPWTFDGDYTKLAGLTVAVGSGTNQEKILLEWGKKVKEAGLKPLNVKYYQDTNSQILALQSGKIDAYFGPNPGVAYAVQQNKDGEKPLRVAGTFSGAGASLQGLIAATTKKDSGLVDALAAAINHLIETGQYADWLKAYNLSNESVEKSEINPPGLPKSNS